MNLYIFYFFIFTLNAQELVPKPRPTAPRSTTQLFQAIEAGNKEAISAAIKSGVDINRTNKHEDTALTFAIKLALKKEEPKIVKLLLKTCPNSIDINKSNGQQTPPIILAMENPTETSYEIFAKLIKRRPDLSYIGHDGYNAIQMAIETPNNFYFSEILAKYDHGDLLKLKNGCGKDLIDLAIEESDSSKTSMLLKSSKMSEIFKTRIMQKLTLAASKKSTTENGIDWSVLATQASKVKLKRKSEETTISTKRSAPDWKRMYI
jgi:hypothetical protein